MDEERAYYSQPHPLREHLITQLRARGYAEPSAAQCARQLVTASDPAATDSLLVDLGSCNLLEGDTQGAIAAWRQVIPSAEPVAASRALLNLGLLYEHEQRHGEAAAVLYSTVDRGVEPYASRAAMAMARCECRSGDYNAAMQILAALTDTAMSADPQGSMLGEALLALGDAAAGAGLFDRADRAWRAARSSSSRTASAIAASRLASRSGDDDSAPITGQSSAVGAIARGIDVLDRVVAHTSDGRRQEARELLITVVGASLTPNERFQFVDELLNHELVNRAIDELEVLLGSDVAEQRLRAVCTLGEIYRSHQMLTEAETMYLEGVNSSDAYWSAKAAVGLAEVLEEIGDDAAAVTAWEQAAASPVDSIRSAAEARLAARGASPAGTDSDVSSNWIESSEMSVEFAQIARPTAVGESPAWAAPPNQAHGLKSTTTKVASPEFASVVRSALVAPEADTLIALPDAADDSVVVVLPSPEQRPPQFTGSSPRPDLVPTGAFDPVVINLREAANRSGAANGDGLASVSSAASGDRLASTPNPYAALAPDGVDDGPRPTSRNPYAELAPGYQSSQPDPAHLVEPEHWRSMLEDWPAESRSGLFGRYL